MKQKLPKTTIKTQKIRKHDPRQIQEPLTNQSSQLMPQ